MEEKESKVNYIFNKNLFFCGAQFNIVISSDCDCDEIFDQGLYNILNPEIKKFITLTKNPESD